MKRRRNDHQQAHTRAAAIQRSIKIKEKKHDEYRFVRKKNRVRKTGRGRGKHGHRIARAIHLQLPYFIYTCICEFCRKLLWFEQRRARYDIPSYDGAFYDQVYNIGPPFRVFDAFIEYTLYIFIYIPSGRRRRRRRRNIKIKNALKRRLLVRRIKPQRQNAI